MRSEMLALALVASFGLVGTSQARVTQWEMVPKALRLTAKALGTSVHMF
ncbi:hypothetical protein [Lampropedia puyangensis]|nr:hypothetical protein [Lampropedia puyangensis]